MGKKTTGLMLAFAVSTAVLTTATPASASAAQTSPPVSWVKAQDFESQQLCKDAGLVGQFFGLWSEGGWKCEGSTLYVRQYTPTPAAG